MSECAPVLLNTFFLSTTCGNLQNITNFQNVPNGGTTWCMRARKEGQFVLKMNFASNISSLENLKYTFFCMKIVILQNDKLKRLNDVLDIMAYNKKDNLVFLEVDLISKVRCKGRWTWRKGSSNLLSSIGLKKTTYNFRSPSVLQSEGGILAQAVEDQGSRVGKSPWWRSSNISSSSLSPSSS